MGRSVIIEDHQEKSEVLADSRRICEFNKKGMENSPKGSGVRLRAEPSGLMLLMVVGMWLLSCR